MIVPRQEELLIMQVFDRPGLPCFCLPALSLLKARAGTHNLAPTVDFNKRAERMEGFWYLGRYRDLPVSMSVR